MKLFWLILAVAPAFCLNAQTNSAPPSPESSLWAMPAVSLKQTNLPAADLAAIKAAALTNGALHSVTNPPPKERPPTRISSEHGEVDLKNHVVIYSGHVVVLDPQMKLTCETLTASAPTNSTQVDHIIAEGSVRIEGEDSKGRPVRAKSDKAIYNFIIVNAVTNKTITLTGNVFVDSALGSGTAEPIVWDLVNDTIHMENQDMQIIPETKGGTNAPLFKPLGKTFP